MAIAYAGLPGCETDMNESRLDIVEEITECSANRKIVTYLLDRSEQFRVLCAFHQNVRTSSRAGTC